MKKLFAYAIAASIFNFAATAQTERVMAPGQKQERHAGKEGKMKMMKELNLTKEQKAQLKAGQKEMKAKHEALKAQDNITVKEMREKQAALRAEQKSRMDAILTPEQRTKMAEIRKQKMAEKGNRGHGKKNKNQQES